MPQIADLSFTQMIDNLKFTWLNPSALKAYTKYCRKEDISLPVQYFNCNGFRSDIKM